MCPQSLDQHKEEVCYKEYWIAAAKKRLNYRDALASQAGIRGISEDGILGSLPEALITKLSGMVELLRQVSAYAKVTNEYYHKANKQQ